MNKPKLLASAPTVELIEGCARKWFIDDSVSVDRDSLQISRAGAPVNVVRVRKLGKRYRLEYVGG